VTVHATQNVQYQMNQETFTDTKTSQQLFTCGLISWNITWNLINLIQQADFTGRWSFFVNALSIFSSLVFLVITGYWTGYS